MIVVQWSSWSDGEIWSGPGVQIITGQCGRRVLLIKGGKTAMSEERMTHCPDEPWSSTNEAASSLGLESSIGV